MTLHRLQEISHFFNHLSPASLDQIDTVYDSICLFRDPFNLLNTRAEIRQVYAEMFDRLHNPSFQIRDLFAGNSPHQWMLTWEFTFAPKRRPRQQTRLPGSTYLALNTAGLIIEHIDYWDPSPIYVQVPLIGRFLKSKLAPQI